MKHRHPNAEPNSRGGYRRGRGPLDYGDLRLFLLALINEAPSHGYELIRSIEAKSGGRYIPSPGVIYPNLAWLEDLGYIAPASDTGRKSFLATAEGKAFLQANRTAADALLARDWSKSDDERDPIRSGMHEIKSALTALAQNGEPPPRLVAEVSSLLRSTAANIRGLALTGQGELPAPPVGTNDIRNAPLEQIVTRHRFDTRRRMLTVRKKTLITPNMIRFVMHGEDLGDFTSLGPDDHIKLMFDTGGDKPQMRDYTPRAYDPEARTLTLDFAVHDAGPATKWAVDARIGDTLTIGGPRGSAVVAPVFDWWLLIGDETALPAMGRWVEEMSKGMSVTTLGLVTDAAEEQIWQTKASHQAKWLHRADPANPEAPLAAAAALELPEGRGFIWIAAEAAVARALREHFQTERAHPREWLKAAGYWVSGEADANVKSFD